MHEKERYEAVPPEYPLHKNDNLSPVLPFGKGCEVSPSPAAMKPIRDLPVAGPGVSESVPRQTAFGQYLPGIRVSGGVDSITVHAQELRETAKQLETIGTHVCDLESKTQHSLKHAFPGYSAAQNNLYSDVPPEAHITFRSHALSRSGHQIKNLGSQLTRAIEGYITADQLTWDENRWQGYGLDELLARGGWNLNIQAGNFINHLAHMPHLDSEEVPFDLTPRAARELAEAHNAGKKANPLIVTLSEFSLAALLAYRNGDDEATSRILEKHVNWPPPSSIADVGRMLWTAQDVPDDTIFKDPTEAQITRLTDKDGSNPRYIVSLPGTKDWGLSSQSTTLDMATNYFLLVGYRPAVMRETDKRLEEVMRRNGDDPKKVPLMLAGHSQGGNTAARLASDKAFQEKYNVKSVLVAGAGTKDLVVPDKTKVLAVEHDEDPVPQLSGPQAKAATNITVVHRNLTQSPRENAPHLALEGKTPCNDSTAGHQISGYIPTLVSIDNSTDKSIVGWRQDSEIFFTADRAQTDTLDIQRGPGTTRSGNLQYALKKAAAELPNP